MTFAERMRQAAKRLTKFRTRDLADVMEVQNYAERARVRDYVRDFLKRGEFKRIDRGLYRYVAVSRPVTIRQRLWNVVRRMPSPYFSLDDLEQLTEGNRETIKEFCGWLVTEGYTVRIKKGHFRRVKPFEIDAPPDRKKIERLRRIRKSLTERTEGTEKNTSGACCPDCKKPAPEWAGECDACGCVWG